jgi:F-type H+-transporting ATPase subunit b
MGSTGLWSAIAFFLFAALLVGAGAHKKVLGMLDARSLRIKAELDEARQLREEAQRVLAGYQRRRQDAENEAKAIIAGAEAEARMLAGEARKKAEEFVTRRTKMAEMKIAQAESHAIAEVRAVAADAAVDAAERLLKGQLKGKTATAYLDASIADVKAHLNESASWPHGQRS